MIVSGRSAFESGANGGFIALPQNLPSGLTVGQFLQRRNERGGQTIDGAEWNRIEGYGMYGFIYEERRSPLIPDSMAGSHVHE